MTVSVSKVSTKGQIVLPVDIRRELDIHPRDKLLLVAEDDTLIVKKIESTGFRELMKPLWEKTRKLGMTQGDVDDIIEEARSG